jgi:hypothetical protein
MKASNIYWLAAVLCLAAPFVAVGEQTSLALFVIFGAVPLSILSVGLGFTALVHPRDDAGEWVVAAAWLVGASLLCVPFAVLMPNGSLVALLLPPAAASAALLVASIRGLRSGTPALPRLVRVGALCLAALLLARTGLRAYASLHESGSQGTAAMMAEARLFAAVAILCAVGLCLSAAGERAWRRPA